MKNTTIRSSLLFVFALLIQNWALGNEHGVQSQSVLEIYSEKYPGDVFHLGVNVDEDQNVKSLFYKDEAGVVQTYSLKDLVDGVVLVQSEGTNVIYMETNWKPTQRKGVVTFTYLYNGIFGSYREASVQLKFNPSMNQYQVVDVDGSGRVIQQAYISLRRTFSKVIGIASIDLR